MRSSDCFLVIVDPSLGRTGAFVCAQNIARALNGVMPCHLVVPQFSRFTTDDLQPFQSTSRLVLRSTSRRIPASYAWLLTLIPSGIKLRRLLAQTKATHLVLNDFYLLHGIICKLLGFQGHIITWVRVEPKRAGGRFTALLWMLIGLSATRVLAVSYFVQQRIPAWLKPFVLYDCLASCPEKPNQDCVYGRFVYLGHLMPGKGQNHAIEAFARIADIFPEAVLEFYGGTLDVPSNIEWEKNLLRRCQLLGLHDRIVFHGPYVDPFIPLKRAFVALNFSESETFSFTILEALSAGVPVIATDCGGPSELIEHKQTGSLVPVGDHIAMASAMAEFLNQPQTTVTMGEYAFRRMKDRFSMEKYRNQLLHYLHD